MRYFFIKASLLFCLFLGAKISSLQAQATSPDLQCVNILPGGTIQLSWQSLATCGTTFSAHHIYFSTDGINFSLLTSITAPAQSSFEDIVNIASTSSPVYYYMTTECGTLTSPPSATVNTSFPTAPNIVEVSVINDDFLGAYTTVQWEASVSPETHGYIIYRSDEDGNFTPIDTLYSSLGGTYEDFDAMPDIFSESYVMAAFDSCAIDPGTTSIPHSSLYLTVETDTCGNRDVNLSWNFYEAWNSDEVEYHILGSFASIGALSTLDTIPGTTNTYTYTVPDEEESPCFMIRARNLLSEEKSQSNLYCLDLSSNDGPAYMYMSNTTVLADNTIRSTWLIDLDNELVDFDLLRGEGDSINLSYIDPLGYTPTSSTVQFTDSMNINTSRYDYVYQLQHTDACNRSSYATVGKTMLLKGRDQFNFENGLDWSPFELTFGTVNTYNIYRKPNDGSTYSLLASVAGGTLTYNDPIADLSNNATAYCYYIEAEYHLEIPSIGIDTLLSSKSNEICIALSSRIYVPNAFAPNGINNIFKPIIIYPNTEAYSLTIMNRWGEVVFSTTAPDEGWNGEYGGELSAQGVYTYFITMTGESGYKYERKGTLMLVR